MTPLSCGFSGAGSVSLFSPPSARITPVPRRRRVATIGARAARVGDPADAAFPTDVVRLRAVYGMTAAQRTRQLATGALRHARRLIVLVVGLTVVAIGGAMIVLPGPAVVVIPVGLAILATEFVWARRLLDNLRERGRNLVGKYTQNRDSEHPD